MMLSPGDVVPALAVTILFLTSLGGWGPAQASPLAPALLGIASSSSLPVAPARWRYYRYRYRYNSDGEDDQSSLLWKRGDESYGSGSVARPFMPIVPAEPQRRSRWVDPPPQ